MATVAWGMYYSWESIHEGLVDIFNHQLEVKNFSEQYIIALVGGREKASVSKTGGACTVRVRKGTIFDQGGQWTQ